MLYMLITCIHTVQTHNWVLDFELYLTMCGGIEVSIKQISDSSMLYDFFHIFTIDVPMTTLSSTQNTISYIQKLIYQE